MGEENSAGGGALAQDLAQFDLAQEIVNSEEKKPWPMGRLTRMLFKKSDFRTVLISMERGAILKEHQAEGTISVQVLKGAIRFRVQESSHDLRAGGLLTLGASIRHEVEALDESAFLLTIAWHN